MKRSNIKTAAAILLVALILFSAVWPLVGGDELFGFGGGSRQGGAGPRSGQGDMPGGTPPTFDGTPGANMPGGMMQGTPSAEMQGTPQPGQAGAPAADMQPGMPGDSGQGDLIQIMRVLQYALYAVIIVCGLIAFGGIWMGRRWGSVMAVVTALVVIVMTVSIMFTALSTTALVVNIARLVLAASVIVLAVLPGTKTTVEVHEA